VALKLGRPFLERYGRYLLLSGEKLEKLEVFFDRHGAISTLVGRLLPGIRQYISLPAGLSKMEVLTFGVYTTIGAGAWVSTLAIIGYLVGNNEELLKRHLHMATIAMVILSLAITVLYVSFKRRSSKK